MRYFETLHYQTIHLLSATIDEKNPALNLTPNYETIFRKLLPLKKKDSKYIDHVYKDLVMVVKQNITFGLFRIKVVLANLEIIIFAILFVC